MLGLIIHLVHYLFIDFKHSWWLLLIFSSDGIIYWNLSVCFCTSSIFPVMQSCHIWYLLYKLSIQFWKIHFLNFLHLSISKSLLSVDISSLQNVWGAAPWACCYADASIMYVNMFQAPLDRRSIANANNKTNLNTDRSITLQGQNLWRFYQYISI